MTLVRCYHSLPSGTLARTAASTDSNVQRFHNHCHAPHVSPHDVSQQQLYQREHVCKMIHGVCSRDARQGRDTTATHVLISHRMTLEAVEHTLTSGRSLVITDATTHIQSKDEAMPCGEVLTAIAPMGLQLHDLPIR